MLEFIELIPFINQVVETIQDITFDLGNEKFHIPKGVEGHVKGIHKNFLLIDFPNGQRTLCLKREVKLVM